MSQAWFKPHSHGIGASPANWKGWASLGVFVLAVMGVAISTVGGVAEPSLGRWMAFLVLTAILAVGFVLFAKAKTGEEWRWRWGNRGK